MSDANPLASLRRILTAKDAPPIDDTLLAEIASAEAAGEDVEALYALELQQIEASLPLAEAYAELVAMMETAVSQMAAAAAAVSPQDVYVHLLQRQLAAQMDAGIILEPHLRALAAELAQNMTGLPHTAVDIPEPLLHAAAGQLPAALRPPLIAVIRENVATLALYLRGHAAALWMRAFTVTPDQKQGAPFLQFGLAPASVPVMSGAETGQRRVLFNQRVGRPLAQNVTVEVEQTSALACTLRVQRVRPGLMDAANQVVQVTYGAVLQTAVTDATGAAHINDIPISALPTLAITLL